MQATAELYPQEMEIQRPQLEIVERPSIYDIMQYSVKLDFSRSTPEADKVSVLVEDVRDMLRRDPTADFSRMESSIEDALLLDADGLDEFARVFVNAHMADYDFRPGTCGLAGIRYMNSYCGKMGLEVFKTRIKKGRNTLAKAFRKSQIDRETAESVLDGKAPYSADHENKVLTYTMGDCSAARSVFETEQGISMMLDWVDSQKNTMRVVGFEKKDKPTYRATHVHIEYNSRIRELQLMTLEAEQASIADGYHNPTKNDVVELARQY